MASVSLFSKKSQPDAGTVAWFNDCVERGRHEVFSETITVTPGLANELLRRNPGNRKLSEKKIGKYARDMVDGQWTLNGETIIIANSGELNNGQHRLSAIIEANRPIPLLMVFGVSRESRTTVDQGMARSAAHYLAMQGFENTKTCASIANIIIAFEQSNGESARGEITHAQIIARVGADTDLVASAHFAAAASKFARGVLAPSQIGACHYLFAEVSRTDADEFMKQVCVGENIKRGQPAFTVRHTLSEMKGERREDRIEAVMRGWVAFRQGRGLNHIKFLKSFPALV